MATTPRGRVKISIISHSALATINSFLPSQHGSPIKIKASFAIAQFMRQDKCGMCHKKGVWDVRGAGGQGVLFVERERNLGRGGVKW